MKNILESFAVFLVALLSLAIMFFIVQYNLIEEDDTMEEITLSVSKKDIVKDKTKSYLDSLEGYGDDTDIKVDARVESKTNLVVVKSELNKDDLGAAVEDKSKSSYMKNLASYADVAEKEKLDTLKPKEDGTGAPQTLEDKEVIDKGTMSLDRAMDSAVSNKTNSETMKELEKYYSDESEQERKKESAHVVDTSEAIDKDDPERLEHDEIVDEIGMAIDAALEDL